MHDSVRDFFSRMKKERPSVFAAKRVAEFGSFDINGNPRHLFSVNIAEPDGNKQWEYVGIDWRKGPNVDEIGLAHEYAGRPHGHFQTIICSSMLEHDPHWNKSLRHLVDILAVDGSLIITTTAPGFHAHEIETSPAGPDTAAGAYFENRTMADVMTYILAAGRFKHIIAEDDPVNHDIRVFCYLKLPPAVALEVK